MAVVAKGTRAGESNPDGYVCSRSEANQYALRALQQQAHIDAPGQTPLLLLSEQAHEGVRIAIEKFALRYLILPVDAAGALNLDELRRALLSPTYAGCPVIFAATLANYLGGDDDLAAITLALAAHRRTYNVPVYLHVDAARSFDYRSTLSDTQRKALGLPRLLLRHPQEEPLSGDVFAASIVAGGLNWVDPPHVVILKHRAVGRSGRHIEYVQGKDSTVSGSRDALNGLVVALQELRFGEEGMRHIFARCAMLRHHLCANLHAAGLETTTAAGNLDVALKTSTPLPPEMVSRWGLVVLSSQTYMLTLQPSVMAEHIRAFIHDITGTIGVNIPNNNIDLNTYHVPEASVEELRRTSARWHSLSRRSCGYPGNQSTLSALGPVVGRILTKAIPRVWVNECVVDIIDDLKDRLGVSLGDRKRFVGGITSGSTMGNQVGLLNALQHCPYGMIYMSTSSHYSVKKTAEANDAIMQRFGMGGAPRFAEVEADALGSMIPEALARLVQRDRSLARSRGEPHQVVLLANFGTTFSGATDNIVALQNALATIGTQIDYIHADGALNFGAGVSGIRLGAPGEPVQDVHGKLVVQGITISNHKFPGLRVSGQVVCFAPPNGKLAAMESQADPHVVFEMWLYSQLFKRKDIERLHNYCMANANRLRDLLQKAGIGIRANNNSFITLIERQAIWFINDFGLPYNEDWIHFITMPHVTPELVDTFATALIMERVRISYVLETLDAEAAAIFQRPLGSVKLTRLDCRNEAQLRQVSVAMQAAMDVPLHLATLDINELVDKLKQKWARGAMSFVAMSSRQHKPLAFFAFLMEATPQRQLIPKFIFTHPDALDIDHTRAEVQRQRVVQLADTLILRLVENGVLRPNTTPHASVSERMEERVSKGAKE